MRKSYFKILLMTVVFFTAITTSAQQGPTLYNFTADAQNWVKGYGVGTVAHDPTGGAASDGALTVDREGNNNANIRRGQGGDDTFIVLDRAVYKYIKIVYKNETNATFLQIRGQSRDAGTAVSSNFPTVPNVSISSKTTGFQTVYADITAIPAGQEITRLDILAKNDAENDAVGSKMIYDEIEFIESLPPPTYSEFIKNPSFDDVVGGISHITGNTAEFNKAIDGTVSKDGSNSYRMSFDKIVPTKINWNFTNYTHGYTTAIVENSIIEVKMWVKTSRTGATAPFRIVQRTKLTLAGADVKNPVAPDGDGSFPSDIQTSTNTASEWEELTFTYTAPGNFDAALFWFAVDFEADSDINMNLNDVVWFDQMSVTISDPATASVNDNVLEGINVYPNPVSDRLNISSPIASKISLYNILGKNVRTAISNSETTTLQVSDLPTGVYMLKINLDNKIKTSKVIIR